MKRVAILFTVASFAVALSPAVGPSSSAFSAPSPQPIVSINSTQHASAARSHPYFADDGEAQLDPGSSLSAGITVNIPSQDVSITVSPPINGTLAVANFTNLDAQGSDTTKDSATIAIGGSSDNYVGNLDILDLATNSSGEFTRFDVVLDDQHQASPGALFGEIQLGEPQSGGLDIGSRHLEWPTTAVKSAPILATEWLHNTTMATQAIGRVSLSAGATGDYSISEDGCSSRPLAAGATCSLVVGFSPTRGGPRDAVLTIPTDTSPQLVSLSGDALMGTTSIETSGSDFVDEGEAGGATSHSFPDGSYQTVEHNYQSFTAYVPNGGADLPTGQSPMTIEVSAPSTIKTGTHAAAYPFTSSGYGLDVSAFNRGCSSWVGTENVKALVRGTSSNFVGPFTMVNISFSISCDGATKPMTGTLMWAYRSDRTAPQTVTKLAIKSASTHPTATWTKSKSSDAVSSIARLVPGAGTGATPLSGYALTAGTATSVKLPTLNAGERYTVVVFSIDKTGNVSAGTKVAVTGRG